MNPDHKWEHKFPRSREGIRSIITAFSRKSRARLMARAAQLPFNQDCLFITLTTPWDIPAKEMKRLLSVFIKRMIRKYPKFGALWKMEPHKKGDWHFHLLVYGVGYLPHRVAKAIWAAILKTNGVKGAYHRGVDVEFCQAGNQKKVRNYLMKYMSKEFDMLDHGEPCGRVWGYRGHDHREPIERVNMTKNELVWLWRIISRKQKRNVVKISTTFLSDDPYAWLDSARKLAKLNSS